MMLQQKADIASATTVGLSGTALWLHNTNAWFAEYMPLITGASIIIGTILTATYYGMLWRNNRRKDAREQQAHDAQYGRRATDPKRQDE